ncbi:hypothetical protein BV898_09220 [Hypsibius exemplaris]|uniref:Uncharacterized protein n=1 Tax=Hypsibius exemplaris TaxID=2072580 RepID=A0A1W0WNC5_HYPEX|nr:hypothetical protein BV898_09220 [Hypsibius exemplaris]
MPLHADQIQLHSQLRPFQLQLRPKAPDSELPISGQYGIGRLTVDRPPITRILAIGRRSRTWEVDGCSEQSVSRSARSYIG